MFDDMRVRMHGLDACAPAKGKNEGKKTSAKPNLLRVEFNSLALELNSWPLDPSRSLVVVEHALTTDRTLSVSCLQC